MIIFWGKILRATITVTKIALGFIMSGPLESKQWNKNNTTKCMKVKEIINEEQRNNKN